MSYPAPSIQNCSKQSFFVFPTPKIGGYGLYLRPKAQRADIQGVSYSAKGMRYIHMPHGHFPILPHAPCTHRHFAIRGSRKVLRGVGGPLEPLFQPPKELWAMARVHRRQSAQSAEGNGLVSGLQDHRYLSATEDEKRRCLWVGHRSISNPPPPLEGGSKCRLSFFHVFHAYPMTKPLALSQSVPVTVTVTVTVSLQEGGGGGEGGSSYGCQPF